MIFWLSSLALTASALLGGGTRAGFIGDVVAQLLAIPMLLAIGWTWAEGKHAGLGRANSGERWLILAAATYFGMLLIQLLPLPAGMWANWLSAVPAHLAPLGDDVSPAPWRGLSLTPAATWAAAISLLPPVAVFLGVSQLDAALRLKLVALVIALGAVGLLIGFLQVAQGPQSELRFFEVTNPSEAVGFFANRNHFAAALYTALVFTAVWFAYAAKDVVRVSALETRAILWFIAALLLMVAIIAGIALARSRAGVVLTFAAIAGVVAMVFLDRTESPSEGRAHRRGNHLIVPALAFAILFAAQLGLHRVVTRFQADPLQDLRNVLTPVTLRAAWDSLPFGTGLGSFPSVYASIERNADLISSYANRAHNDWAEFLLEGGAPAAAVLLLFLYWFGRKVADAWRPARRMAARQDMMIQRAGTIVIALLLAHSFVDYPLRTTAMSVLFAFACALLLTPPRAEAPARPAPVRQSGRRRVRRSRPSPERWGTDLDWPNAWKRNA